MKERYQCFLSSSVVKGFEAHSPTIRHVAIPYQLALSLPLMRMIQIYAKHRDHVIKMTLDGIAVVGGHVERTTGHRRRLYGTDNLLDGSRPRIKRERKTAPRASCDN